jgi:hypothetical protein
MAQQLARRRTRDARIFLAPIAAASGEKPYPVAVAANQEAIAVVLDFVEPVGATAGPIG